MKTIILSDVNSKSESIIPYGLRLGRALESEVDVLHIIDKRVHQGTYGSVSDSQSITPGETMSQDEILKREKSRANLALDKKLSSEASRLNYPLKVNRVVKTNILEEELEKQAKENPNCIFVMSAEADNYMFDSTDDIVSTVRDTGIAALLVPPEKKFKDYKNILLPVNFESKEFNAFTDVKFLFENFTVLVDAVTVSSKSDYNDMELKASAWKKVAKDHFLQPTTLKTNVLEGENFKDTVLGYTQKNEPDLILMFQKKENPVKTIFKQNELDVLLNKTNIPVLVYYHS